MRRNNSEKGQTTLLYTLSLTVMFGMVGLTVDVGWSYFREQAVQTAAEAAAMAGVQAAVASSLSGITCGSNHVVCQAATACPNSLPDTASSNMDHACMYAKDNGFQSSTSGQKVYIAAAKAGAPVANLTTQYWVSATIAEQSKLTFLSILGGSKSVVSKRVTAAAVGSIQGQCVYVLDPAAQNAMVVSGSGSLRSGCGVYVKSTNNKALQVTGGGTVVATAGGVNLIGGDAGSNDVGASSSCTGCIYPAPTSVGSVSDPLATLEGPPVGGCDHTNASYGSGTTPVLDPGVYCGGISASSDAQVTLNPGIYILNGGGLTVSSSHAKLSGSGVMFYVTGDASHSYGPVTVQGGATVELSPPTSGKYSNMLFFQDRTKGDSSTVNTFSGGSDINVSGVLYFPTQKLVYSGGSSTNALNLAIVADILTISGSSYMGSNGLSANGGTGSKIVIIE